MQKKKRSESTSSKKNRDLFGMPTMLKNTSADTSEMAGILMMMEKLLHWAAIIESSDDAILSKSMDGYITSWNRGAERLYGYTADEIIGKPVSVLMPPERADDFTAIMKQLREGKMVDHYETRRKTKDGRVIDVSITVSPIKDTKGNIIGASKIARDISERLEYQRRREDFVSSVSHELKTPLTTQKVYIELLQELIDRKGDKQYKPFIQKVVRQTEKLEKLVSDLLQASRGYMGKLQLQRGTFFIEEVLEDTVTDLQQISSRNIILRKNSGTPVLGDKDRIGQVITNLLTNAIKFSDNGGEIIVTCSKEDDRVVVSVRDFGIGIHKKYLDKIFEKFYRLDESSYPGMGIGLNFSREIVLRHGGDIWVESELGKGSTFYFALPVTKGGKL